MKAAALNLTQSLRALLASQGVMVHTVILSPVDTDMNRGFNIPKVSSESAAACIFDGLESFGSFLDNYFNFTHDETDWKGPKIDFELFRKADKNSFTHLGLVPQYDCFDVCLNAWGSHINGSLRSLITTGKGHWNERENAAGK